MRLKWPCWVSLGFAVWLLVSAFALDAGDGDGATVAGVVAGIAVAVLAGVALRTSWRWASWAIVIIGAGLIGAPFALGYADTQNAGPNAMIVGAAFIILGMIAALATRTAAGGDAAHEPVARPDELRARRAAPPSDDEERRRAA